MSLKLGPGTKPEGISIKTYGADIVFLGEYEIPIKDFLVAAHYVLTNTDLEGLDDPRKHFVKHVQSMKETKGYNPGQKRLESSVPLCPFPKKS